MGKHTDAREVLNRPAAILREGAAANPVLVSAAPDQRVHWLPGERLDQLFEERCDTLREAGRGDSLAVDAGDVTLTYDELDARANQLARYLLARGAVSGSRIALLFDQAVWSYIAMLAVLKIQAAYVPLDVGFPPERLSYIVSDSGASMVLSLSHLRERLPETGAPFVSLDVDEARVGEEPGGRLTAADKGAAVDELCYIIYTSGSTGRPKGVEIEHASICNFVRVASDVYGIKSSDRVYQGMTIAFDFSVEEIWVSWMAGATLVPKSGGVSLLGPDLGEFLVDRGITALCCVPTLLATLEQDVAGLRFLLVSGEACPQDLMARWHRPDRRFLNVYGPTEATVTATWTVVDPDRPATLGVPLPSYSAVILDPERDAPVPWGELGEICLAGIGLARGYVNRRDLTDKVFIPDFLSIPNNPPARIYRTGDLGRINGDGEIEYHGRIDTQVKIRGYRIELSEVESVLLQMPGIAQAAVGTYDPETGITELVAYFSRRRGSAEIDARVMQDRLRGLLPAYMVPAFFEELASIPMLPSDKVDRKRLPQPSGKRLTGGSREPVAPSTKTEQILARALADIMGSETVSVEDHFFSDLGANSMLMAKFCARVRQLGQLAPLSMKDTYLRPTVRSLAGGMGSQAALVVRTPTATVPPRRASAAEYVLCGTLQAIMFVVASFFAGFLLLEGYAFASAGNTFLEVLLLSAVFTTVSFLALCLLPILAKWLLIGRWKVQEIPLWTLAYFRFWLVRTLIRANPMRIFLGSPLYVVYLRALGANIGRGVAIFSSDVPVCTDLLTVGDGAVIRKDSTFNCYRAIDGVIQTGPVTIGRDAIVGEAAVIDVGCSVGDGAQLGHVSTLFAGQAVPAGEHWHGCPAERTDVDYGAVQPAECGTRRRVLYSLFMVVNRLLLVAPVGIGSLFAIIPQYLGTDHLNHAYWLFYVDTLVFSLVVVIGGIFTSLAFVITVPRFFNLLLKPDRVYPLYGVRYGAHRTVVRLTNLKMLLALTGDSSLIVHYLRVLGFKLPNVEQTGTNFGVAVKFESPYHTTVGPGTMVADGLSIMNADYSSSSFKVSNVTIGARNYLGNGIYYPVNAKTGENCLLATKAMIPMDGPVKHDVGLLGSPAFEIPRSVQRDTTFEDFRTGEKFKRGLAGKNRHNAVTIALYLLVRWIYVFGVLLISSVAVVQITLYGFVSAGLAVLGVFVFSVVYFVLVEWAALGFRRLQPRFCSIYQRHFWQHERFWKLSGAAFFGIFSGTPFKGITWRVLGARVGRRLYDDGAGIPEKSIVSIGDDCMLNAGTVIQCHSMEDGVFKLEGISIGSGCTLGVKSFVHYGVSMGDRAVLEADAFLMKGEEVPPNGWYGGNPASALTAVPPITPAITPAITAPAITGRPAPRIHGTRNHSQRQNKHGRHTTAPAARSGVAPAREARS